MTIRDQENALLRFATAVILLEAQNLNDPRVINRQLRELIQLGINRQQLKVLGRMFLEGPFYDRQNKEKIHA